MNEERLQHAKLLAARNYAVQIVPDETTDGEPIYIARTPELAGCKSQGETIEEAIKNLADARIDYIYFLLEDGLPVPEPISMQTMSGTAGNPPGLAGNLVRAEYLVTPKARDSALSDSAPDSDKSLFEPSHKE